MGENTSFCQSLKNRCYHCSLTRLAICFSDLEQIVVLALQRIALSTLSRVSISSRVILVFFKIWKTNEKRPNCYLNLSERLCRQGMQRGNSLKRVTWELPDTSLEATKRRARICFYVWSEVLGKSQVSLQKELPGRKPFVHRGLRSVEVTGNSFLQNALHMVDHKVPFP